MSFRRAPSQQYFENMFPGNKGIPFRGIKKETYTNLHLSFKQAKDLSNCLNDEISSYYFKSLLSYLESIPAIVSKNYSWATVRLYYSVYYSTRAFLACKDIAFLRAERTLYYIKTKENESFVKCDDTTDHKGTIKTLAKLYGNQDLLLSNSIDDIPAYDWMMKKREEVNYKDIDFHDPNPPDFWSTIDQTLVTGTIEQIVDSLVKDEWIQCFQNDYGILGIPTKRLLLTVREIRSSGKTLSISDEQKIFLEKYLKELTKNTNHELVVWK